MAKPQGKSSSQIDQAIKELPAIAWMAYSIHGNESSGADAALALIYHLIAADDSEVTSLLENMVVLVDREQGGPQQVEAAGYRFHVAFKLGDLLSFYLQEGKIDQGKYDNTMSYIKGSNK